MVASSGRMSTGGGGGGRVTCCGVVPSRRPSRPDSCTTGGSSVNPLLGMGVVTGSFLAAMDFDFAHAMLTETRKEKDNAAAASPSREAYRKCLAEALLQNRTRILAFRAKPPAAMDLPPGPR